MCFLKKYLSVHPSIIVSSAPTQRNPLLNKLHPKSIGLRILDVTKCVEVEEQRLDKHQLRHTLVTIGHIGDRKTQFHFSIEKLNISTPREISRLNAFYDDDDMTMTMQTM